VLGYLALLSVVTILVLLAVGLVVGIVVIALTGLPSPGTVVTLVADPVALVLVAVFGTLIAAVFSPWYTAVVTLLYYDLRWRRGELQPTPTVRENAAETG
jgi:hypothetical protein